MKNLLICVCILCIHPFLLYSQSDCNGSQSSAELNINNIRTNVLQAGSLWWDGSDGKYFAPNDSSGVTAIFAGGLWMGGIAPDSTVRVAAAQYGHGNSDEYDYFPGPLNPLTGEAYPTGCEDWDKHFTVYDFEKVAHQNDFADNNVVNTLQASIFGWPGRNNPYFTEYNGFTLPADTDLAPFIDLNGDNIYDPAAGDYPDTKGDQAIWWVFNDVASEHTQTNGEALGMEIQAMAYAFQSFETEVNNTTFYDFKLTYRGEESLSDFNFALWADVDLGCFTDDYIGFNEERGMAFYYNVDDIDGDVDDQCGSIQTYGEDIPMLGMKLMSDSDNLGVTSFTSYVNNCELGPAGYCKPFFPLQHLYYMTRRWRDGTAITYGEDGFNGTGTPLSYLFSGDPSDENDWSMCSASNSNNPDFDRHTLMSTGGNTLNPGDIKEYSYAVIFVPDVPHPCPSLDMLGAAADVIENFDCIVSSVSEPNFAEEIGLQIIPNPTSQRFTISIDAENTLLKSAEIIDLAGNVLQRENKVNARNLAFNIENLAAGMYFVKVTTNEGKIAVRKLIVQ